MEIVLYKNVFIIIIITINQIQLFFFLLSTINYHTSSEKKSTKWNLKRKENKFYCHCLPRIASCLYPTIKKKQLCHEYSVILQFINTAFFIPSWYCFKLMKPDPVGSSMPNTDTMLLSSKIQGRSKWRDLDLWILSSMSVINFFGSSETTTFVYSYYEFGNRKNMHILFVHIYLHAFTVA